MSGESALGRSLRMLADLADIRGEDGEAAELRRAAAAIEGLQPADATALVQRVRRGGLAGEAAPPSLRGGRAQSPPAAVDESSLTGARDRLPALIRSLLESRSVDTEEAARLVRQLGILTLGDLQQALETGRVGQALGEEIGARLLRAAQALESDARGIPLGRARETLDAVAGVIAGSATGIDLVTPAGDARRFEPLVESLVLVARVTDPAAAVDAIGASRGVDDVLHRGSRRAILSVQQTEIDVRLAAPDEYGTVLFTATGARPHLHAMRARGGHLRLLPREEDLYLQAGLPFIPPELRHGTGEIEAAAAGTLPALIAREDIRGDLHMHTIYSDGADTLDAMVAGCRAEGYEYIAITDHSERAAAGRTLGRKDLSRQRTEILRLRERYPDITILHGAEVDIMPDGSLDFPDRLLETLDIVLASLHDSAGQDAKTLTRRCIQAIRHPLVTVVTHPANRLVGRRTGYALDFAAVYTAAAETGTALEVDGAPSHLDLDGEHAREAIAAGVTLAIDSDCHRARLLGRQMQMGIGTARRGWVEPRHVLNTRPIDQVRAFIAAKRARA